MSKYDVISDIKKKLDVLADAKGALRCGLIWDIMNELNGLDNKLLEEDKARETEKEEMKKYIGRLEEKLKERRDDKNG